MEKRDKPGISTTLDGTLVELVYDRVRGETAFIVFSDGNFEVKPFIDLPSGDRLVPYSPDNNLIEHKVVLLPSVPKEYGSETDLLREVHSFIHRYVDVSPLFERVAAHYVLFSWVYDSFNELPYLRVRGDYGSGKSRFLLTVGSLCYKPMLVSGASTVSPIFRIIDAFRGTLVIDESDFRESDEKAEIVKILNNGNARGFPLLRAEQNQRKEFDPRAYTVFGPKLIATRRAFKDQALESRCLTEDMGQGKLRRDIPLNLPPTFEGEALMLRNKLLLFRFRNLRKPRALSGELPETIEPRLRQIFAPLLSTIEDPVTRREVVSLAEDYGRTIVADRGLELEAQVLEILHRLSESGSELAVKEIAAAFTEAYGEEYGGKVTPRWIGGIIRKRLNLKPRKSGGVFVVPVSEYPKLRHLFERYGFMGDIGDVSGGVEKRLPELF
ncbi:MAG TPA: hypothetical protein VF173_12460 [Thermoanaerobaculia bacterium]|nr:hypothetical protein [Thermoanaerobaculia bacterium]